MARFLAVFVLAAFGSRFVAAEAPSKVSFEQTHGGLQIIIGDQPVAEYVFTDEQICRPYFRALRGI